VPHPLIRGIREARRPQKKARLEGRADKGLEIFFVNEKVCFGKQKLQYSGRMRFRLFTQLTIVYCRNNNSRFSEVVSVVFPHHWVSRISNAI
jgi:hypothetical protein